MTTMDFTKKMYKLDSENMFIVEKTLEDVVLENAEETTSPRGVEPKYHVVKTFTTDEDNVVCDLFELRHWGYRGNGYTTCLQFDNEEDANQALLEVIYKFDFVPSDEYHKWFESEEEAIHDFVDYMKDEDEDITIDSVKGEIEAMRLDIENGKKTVARRLENEMKQAYDFWKANGQITKKANKLINSIKYDGYRHNGIWELYISHKDIATEDTMRMINEMTNSK